MTQLQQLNLWENQIGAEGAAALASVRVAVQERGTGLCKSGNAGKRRRLLQ